MSNNAASTLAGLKASLPDAFIYRVWEPGKNPGVQIYYWRNGAEPRGGHSEFFVPNVTLADFAAAADMVVLKGQSRAYPPEVVFTDGSSIVGLLSVDSCGVPFFNAVGEPVCVSRAGRSNFKGHLSVSVRGVALADIAAEIDDARAALQAYVAERRRRAHTPFQEA